VFCIQYVIDTVLWVCVTKSKVNIAASFTINWREGNKCRRKIALRTKKRMSYVLTFKNIKYI
jgi:hypothetical protein